MTVTEPDLDSFRKPVLDSVPTQFESKWGKGTWDALARYSDDPLRADHRSGQAA